MHVCTDVTVCVILSWNARILTLSSTNIHVGTDITVHVILISYVTISTLSSSYMHVCSDIILFWNARISALSSHVHVLTGISACTDWYHNACHFILKC